MAVSVPLRREGLSRLRSFWFGQLSGMVEVAAGVLGAWAVLSVQALLPYALAFAAGAMIFVVVLGYGILAKKMQKCSIILAEDLQYLWHI